MEPALYLIPSPLQEQSLWGISAEARSCLLQLRHLVVEHARPARRFVAQAARADGLDTGLVGDYHLYELRPDTPDVELMQWAQLPLQGQALGLVSDAGAPGVADPGARLVAWAHELGVPVRPLAGPSSILLALMGSGLQGQRFAFQGYLPVAEGARRKALRSLELQSRQQDMTQVFMETPYRNRQLLQACMEVLQPDTRLGVAADLGATTPYIYSAAVGSWHARPLPELHQRPAIFLIYAGIV
ncbi:MAG: SAM-dependent methyltransferase [Bacteroidetes bacterium]|jgi:16S rRNA (cytidine1402-2'-O)-methyltransferase|nr:SAM-dependent methyltransferase [Bacteroidota bacterium]